MLAHARRRVAAHRYTSSSITRWIGLAAVAALASAIEACTPTPPVPLAGPDPAESRRPVEPQPWQGQNDRLEPGKP